LPAASDLAAARKAFLPFIDSAAAFAAALRAQAGDFASLKIYECPMADQAVPGAPTTARWLQWQGPKHNPFFGSRMIDCGIEVKP
jgi:hypothetical protein